MFIECINNAYNLITGERRFTKGCVYTAKIVGRELLALDDKGEWSQVSTKIGGYTLFNNEVFINHFSLAKSKLKLVI